MMIGQHLQGTRRNFGVQVIFSGGVSMSWLRIFHQNKSMNFYEEICKKSIRKTLARENKVLKFV